MSEHAAACGGDRLGLRPGDASGTCGRPHQLKTLLAPYPPELMTRWPVSARVGNVNNNDPTLIEPIAAA